MHSTSFKVHDEFILELVVRVSKYTKSNPILDWAIFILSHDF